MGAVPLIKDAYGGRWSDVGEATWHLRTYTPLTVDGQTEGTTCEGFASKAVPWCGNSHLGDTTSQACTFHCSGFPLKSRLQYSLVLNEQVQLFINCLLASADYDSFFNVMKKEGEKSLRQKDHLEHDRKATRGEEKESGMSITRPSVGETKAVEQQRRPVERSYK